MLDWDDLTLLIDNPPASIFEAIELISGLPHVIASDDTLSRGNHRVPDLIDMLYILLANWLKAEFSGNTEALALLHSCPLAVCVRHQVDFSLAMWEYAGNLLPKSPIYQRKTGNSQLMLWLTMELSCCCALLGRGGVTRLPDYDPATGRIAGDKAIRRNTKRAIKLHRQAIKYGLDVYHEAKRPVPNKYCFEYILDGVLQHGITRGWKKSDKDLLHHCEQFSTSLEDYMLNNGPILFFLHNGEVHVCSPRSKVPPAKGFLPPKPSGRPKKD